MYLCMLYIHDMGQLKRVCRTMGCSRNDSRLHKLFLGVEEIHVAPHGPYMYHKILGSVLLDELEYRFTVYMYT